VYRHHRRLQEVSIAMCQNETLEWTSILRHHVKRPVRYYRLGFMALSLSRFYTERSDTYERPRETHQSLPQPPPRERRDRPGWFITIRNANIFSFTFTAGDREHNHPSTSQGQRTSPPHQPKATEPSAGQRSRVPLPSQAEAMRFGNVKKSRHVPMDVDVNENISTSDLEQAPTRPKVSRPRGKRYAILLWRFFI
jgi:hypothetical protein